MALSLQLQVPEVADRLILLFHGVGSTPQSMVPLGLCLAGHHSRAIVVSVPSPDPGDLPGSLQWFSIHDLSADERRVRVVAAMPRFIETVREHQANFGMDAERTSLVGFSQGAIMALESTQHPWQLADLVVAIAGRFAALPTTPAWARKVHLIHGEADTVLPSRLSTIACDALTELGTDASVEILAGCTHKVDATISEHASAFLRSAGSPAMRPTAVARTGFHAA